MIQGGDAIGGIFKVLYARGYPAREIFHLANVNRGIKVRVLDARKSQGCAEQIDSLIVYPGIYQGRKSFHYFTAGRVTHG
jgi:hypothetical protein